MRAHVVGWALLTCGVMGVVTGCGSEMRAAEPIGVALPPVVRAPSALPSSPSGPAGSKSLPVKGPGPGYLTTLSAAQAKGLASRKWTQLAPFVPGHGIEAAVTYGGCQELRGARLTTHGSTTEVAVLVKVAPGRSVCPAYLAVRPVRIKVPDALAGTHLVHAPANG